MIKSNIDLRCRRQVGGDGLVQRARLGLKGWLTWTRRCLDRAFGFLRADDLCVASGALGLGGLNVPRSKAVLSAFKKKP